MKRFTAQIHFRGFILKNTRNVEASLNVAGITSIQQSTGYLSVYFSREQCACLPEKTVSLLSWNVASLPTRLRRPVSCVAALICVSVHWKNKQTCSRCDTDAGWVFQPQALSLSSVKCFFFNCGLIHSCDLTSTTCFHCPIRSQNTSCRFSCIFLKQKSMIDFEWGFALFNHV